MEYDFTFVVAGVDVDDHEAVGALMEDCDALLARAGGVDLLCITGSGGSALHAALAAVAAARAAVPYLRVRRLDNDPVGVCDSRDGIARPTHAEMVEIDAALAGVGGG
ncbi:hypothetical protein [Streptomyces sp. enrichment culture]|uniref:hypothetical protein n=1 Tax=Streptomyces sp. enrichment culture TaxID=1795815 RepID=UPI003F54A5FA